MSYPQQFLKAGMKVEYRERSYTVVYASAIGDLRIAPEHIQNYDESERKELWVKHDDPLLTISFYLWANRAAAAHFLETERHCTGYKWLDGPTPGMKQGWSQQLLETAIKRLGTDEEQPIGLLDSWELNKHPDSSHSYFERKVLCSMYGAYSVAKVYTKDRHIHRFGWEVSYDIGSTPHHVKKDRHDYGPSAPRVSHKGDETADVGMAACDNILRNQWILR